MVAVNAEMMSLLGDSSNKQRKVLRDLAKNKEGPVYIELIQKGEETVGATNGFFVGWDDPVLEIQRQLIMVVLDIHGDHIDHAFNSLLTRSVRGLLEPLSILAGMLFRLDPEEPLGFPEHNP